MGQHFDVASCPPIVWQKATGLRVVCYSSHIPPILFNMVIILFSQITMAPIIDMHMHTNFSDGVKTPAELIEYAKQRHLDIMSINDHDTVKGVLHVKTMKVEGISILYGIELSTKWNFKSLHVAGYFPKDADFESIQKFLEKEVALKRYVFSSYST